MDREVRIKLVNGKYEIYINGKLKGSCEIEDLKSLLEKIENINMKGDDE